jgi:D-inositol-3-phosphate glycosyltransferase
MKILYFGEGPWVGTGLAQVTRNILDPLHAAGHQIELVAMNHFYTVEHPEKLPYVIHACPSDDCTNMAKALERIHEGDYDAFIYSADFGRYKEIFDALFEERSKRFFYTIMYSPIDCDIIPEKSFELLRAINVAVTYTHHGADVIGTQLSEKDSGISVIPLACEPDRFYPLSPEERRAARKDLFHIEDDDYFLVVNVNRNQPRKDLGRCIAIYHEFHKKYPYGALYLHCQVQEVTGNVKDMANSVGAFYECIYTGEDFGPFNGFSFETMNRIYNAADCLFSTSTGEGWGLSTTEAMAAGCPVVVPGNTANLEIVGKNEERGLLIKSGGDIDHLTWLYGMVDNPRETVHTSSAIQKLSYVHNNRSEMRIKAGRAREWCEAHDKAYVGQKWVGLFQALESKQESEKAHAA